MATTLSLPALLTAPPALLFIRATPVPQAVRALSNLRRAFPGAYLTTLTHESSRRTIEDSGLVDRVFVFSGSRFGLLAAGLRLILMMRRQQFDYVIVPFTGRRWDAFWNVGRMALAFGGRRTIWLPADRVTAGDLDQCLQVSYREWRRRTTRAASLRGALVHGLKWPALCALYAVGMASLSVLAMILLPLVWLKPPSPPEDAEGEIYA